MTPLVFLPGMMCDARLFAPQIAALSRRFPVMTAPIGQADSMAALARSVLDAAPDRFALSGLSMGGILAMEVIRQAPDRVLGVALLDTNPLAELPEIQDRRAPQIAAVQAGGLDDVMGEQMIPKYTSPATDATAINALCLQMARDLGPDVFANQSIALRDRPDQTDTLRGFDRPSLVLCGRDDALCPVERHDLMHDLLPNSTLTILENTGHLPTLEQPDQTTAALTRWLEAL